MKTGEQILKKYNSQLALLTAFKTLEELIDENIHQAKEALLEINSRNRLTGDLDAYLFNLAEWGQGKKDKRPRPEDFGLVAF